MLHATRNSNINNNRDKFVVVVVVRIRVHNIDANNIRIIKNIFINVVNPAYVMCINGTTQRYAFITIKKKEWLMLLSIITIARRRNELLYRLKSRCDPNGELR